MNTNFLKSLFLLMLVAKFNEVVFASTENSHVTESVEIRASVPSALSIDILEGKDGLDLFDEMGCTKADPKDLTIKFKIKGNFLKAKLSFSGTDGLSCQKEVSSPSAWLISNADNKNGLGVEMKLSGIGKDQKTIDNTAISIGYEDRGKEISVVVVPTKDVESSPLVAGEYKGKLNIKLEAAD